jgi:Domain of unknown function (DUF5916)/Carbohydrate family 9 binding domain-like
MRFFLSTILVLWSFVLISQKVYQITKTTEKIVCDGILNEVTWQGSNEMAEFVQNNPSPGQKASQNSIVKLSYDDQAIYVAATLYDTEPKKILKEYTIRDRSGNADRFGISFDTYADGINAFAFEVTASGIQIDKRITSVDEDVNWDAVWESEVKITEEGWTVEMVIPYNALRFPKIDIQEWKVQVFREIRRLREFSTWNEQKPEVEGEVNQYGILKGIENVESPLRLSLSPYLSGYYDVIERKDNPALVNRSYAAGMDLKYGINDSYTLDMTLIPDFGQVISDQQVLNLTPFEVYFDENRPFFTEGLELFNKGNMFYSRRVGGTPYALDNVAGEARSLGGRVLSNPSVNRLINVSKVSGRNASGLGFGVFNGVEGETNAQIEDANGRISDYKTNPITNYSVLVVDQNLKNNSNISFMNTNVLRHGQFADANVTGMFLTLRDSTQTYLFSTNPVVSNIIGSDGTKTGFANYLYAGKVSGNWIYTLENTIESSDFDVNDLGFLRNPNEFSNEFNYGYNNYKPKNDKIIFYRLSHSTRLEYLYNPMLFTDFNTTFDAFVLFKNRFGWNSTVILEPITTKDYFEPRTQNFTHYMAWGENIRLRQYLSTDYRKKLAVDASATYRYFFSTPWNNLIMSLAPRFRFTDRFSLVYNLNVNLSANEPGYFNRNNLDFTAINPEGHPVLGIRDRNIITSTFTGTYIFNKNLGIDCRLRHYWAEVNYKNYGPLDKEGLVQVVSKPDNNILNSINNNLNLFNIDLQLRWRFRPGSDLFLVWKNSITKFDRSVDYSLVENLQNTFEEPQNNSLSLRAIYWLDVNKVKI